MTNINMYFSLMLSGATPAIIAGISVVSLIILGLIVCGVIAFIW